MVIPAMAALMLFFEYPISINWQQRQEEAFVYYRDMKWYPNSLIKDEEWEKSFNKDNKALSSVNCHSYRDSSTATWGNNRSNTLYRHYRLAQWLKKRIKESSDKLSNNYPGYINLYWGE